MKIPFVNGDLITAARWNTLFGELDAKVTAILDDTTFLLSSTWITGKRFYFNDGPTDSPRTGQNAAYDHAPYSEAANDASLTVALFDAAKKIVAFEQPIPNSYRARTNTADGFPFFNDSLEAHQRLFTLTPDKPETRELYWLLEPKFYHPERISSYGLAELICETSKEVVIQKEWNRYRFFRIHNLSEKPLSVRFEGFYTKHTVTVPAFACRCVRRSTVDDDYLDGWNYFHRFVPGDPTVFQMPYSDATPSGSAGANTVISPALVYRLLDNLRGQSNVYIGLDPHELYDVGGLHREHFPT